MLGGTPDQKHNGSFSSRMSLGTPRGNRGICGIQECDLWVGLGTDSLWVLCPKTKKFVSLMR